jgi:hypothetical protein
VGKLHEAHRRDDRGVRNRLGTQWAIERYRRCDRKQDPGDAGAASCGGSTMISVQQLVEIVGRKVRLKQCGPTTWKGLCPVHNDHNPSFYVYLGNRGEGRYQCKVCGEEGCGGDGIDWLHKFENKSYRDAGGTKPDPEFQRERERRRVRERLIKEFRDGYPECSVPDEFLKV